MEIVQKDAFKVVGIKVVADWENLGVEMPEAWQKFISRHTEIKHKVNNVFINVSLARDGDVYTQLICSEVSAFADIPQGMVPVELPGQAYIHHRHVGPVNDIATSFVRMYQWADDNGHAVDEFKLDIGYTSDGREQEHNLFIRVVPPM